MKGLFAFSLAVLALAVCVVSAAGAGSSHSRTVLYTRESAPPTGDWNYVSRANPYHRLTFTLALKQRNIDVLEKMLEDDSNPASPIYGRHKTREEILDVIAPSVEVQERVVSWLRWMADAHGPSHLQRIRNFRDNIQVTCTVSLAEMLFKTELHTFFNIKRKGTVVKHLGDLSLPNEIAQHVELVTGITEFPPTDLPFIKNREPSSRKLEADQTNACNVPYTLKNLYGVPQNLTITNKNSNMSIYAEESPGYPEGFGLPGLDYFETANNLPLDNITCILGTGLQYYTTYDTDLEAHLDTEMSVGMAEGADICFYIMEYGQGWMFEFANYIFQTPYAPWVISMSYGWVEVEQCSNETTYPFLGNCTYYHIPNSAGYISRTNTEFMKLGLMGYTLVAASGDDGTAGTHGSWDNCQKLGPIYPAASPYVTTVGATSVEPSKKASQQSGGSGVPPICTNPQYGCECSSSTNEQIALANDTAGFDTGGGFSQFSAMLSFQQSTVQAYLSSGVPLPPSYLFNTSNRAFPDIGAVGEQICLLDSSSCEFVGGTSASTPLISSLITLLNQDRLNAGKTTLGFFTPLIYDMYGKNASYYFNTQFTMGNNPGGCPETHGFKANPKGGWNPLVGVGSPKFPAIREYIASLP